LSFLHAQTPENENNHGGNGSDEGKEKAQHLSHRIHHFSPFHQLWAKK